jgi:hypothetical protein
MHLALSFVLLLALQSPPPQNSIELEEFLFVQNANPQGAKGAIYIMWIPQTVLKYCLGKTGEQCAKTDFCIRTTTKNVSTCQNLGLDVSHMHGYPPGTRPERVIGITYFPKAPIKGMDILQSFYASKPRAAFDALSMDVRIKARIKFTRKPNDDDFDVLEFLPAP